MGACKFVAVSVSEWGLERVTRREARRDGIMRSVDDAALAKGGSVFERSRFRYAAARTPLHVDDIAGDGGASESR